MYGKIKQIKLVNMQLLNSTNSKYDLQRPKNNLACKEIFKTNQTLSFRPICNGYIFFIFNIDNCKINCDLSNGR